MSEQPIGGEIAYFGYGSLVNPATHRTPVKSAHVAALHGWRRVWVPRPNMPGFASALLSVEPVADSVIDGLLIGDEAASLPALDAREAHYDRIVLAQDNVVPRDPALAAPVVTFIYAARPVAAGKVDLPILQSYLDAVLQGFLHLGGEAALIRFVESTTGWARDVHRDRHDPAYPRAVRLEASEADMIDAIVRTAQAGL